MDPEKKKNMPMIQNTSATSKYYILLRGLLKITMQVLKNVDGFNEKFRKGEESYKKESMRHSMFNVGHFTGAKHPSVKLYL